MCRGFIKHEVCQNHHFALLCKLGDTKNPSVWQYIPASKGSKATVSHRDNKTVSLLDNLESPISADFHIHLDLIPLICQTLTETTGSLLLRR